MLSLSLLEQVVATVVLPLPLTKQAQSTLVERWQEEGIELLYEV